MIDGTAHCRAGETGVLCATDGGSAEGAFSQIIIDGIPGLFFVVDRDGALKRWNRNLEALLGLAGEQLKGSPIQRAAAGEDRGRLISHLDEVFANGNACAELRLSSQSGARHIRLTSTRIDCDGCPCLMGIGVDISDLKAVEALQAGQNRVLVSLATGESL